MKRLRWSLLILGAVAGCLLISVGSVLHGQSTPTLQDALAATVRQLGACQSQNGTLLTLQADILSQKYVDWPTVKQTIEAANPTLTLNLETKKLAPKETK